MRIKRFDVTVEFLKQFLTNGHIHFSVFNGIPNDAELVRIHVDPNIQTIDKISFFFMSESFPDVPKGYVLTSEKVTIVTHYDDASI